MGLDQSSRGVIEKMIDNIISDIPDDMETYRIPSIKSNLQIKEEADFVLGVGWGRIISGFANYFKKIYGREPNEEEADEITRILIKRTREIREAIFKTG